MNADARVMEFYPSLVSREESRVRFELWRAREAEHGYSSWPVEVIGGAPFIGMVGLSNPDFTAPFLPAVEIGWRLAAEHWGRGYATEAARAVVAHGFERLGLARDRVVHDDRQRPLAPGHGEARHAALARRGFPAPVGRGGAPGAAARPVSAAATRRSRRSRSGEAPRRLKSRPLPPIVPPGILRVPVPSHLVVLACAALPARRLRARHRPAGQGQRSHAGPADVLGVSTRASWWSRAQIPGQPDITAPSVILCAPAAGERVIDVKVLKLACAQRGHRAGLRLGRAAHGARGQLHGAAAAPAFCRRPAVLRRRRARARRRARQHRGDGPVRLQGRIDLVRGDARPTLVAPAAARCGLSFPVAAIARYARWRQPLRAQA